MNANDTDWRELFYSHLEDLTDSTFPKHCPCCGKVFDTKDAFIEATTPVRDTSLQQGSGLFTLDDDRSESVSMFRNCTCGSTLMAEFHSRRDHSQHGHDRRQRFDELLTMLMHRGMSHQAARAELLRVLKGQSSSRISELLDELPRHRQARQAASATGADTRLNP